VPAAANPSAYVRCSLKSNGELKAEAKALAELARPFDELDSCS